MPRESCIPINSLLYITSLNPELYLYFSVWGWVMKLFSSCSVVQSELIGLFCLQNGTNYLENGGAMQL